MILNHISGRFDQDEGKELARLAEEAKLGARGVSAVALAHDFMEVIVPWLGFRSTRVEGGDATKPAESGAEDSKVTITSPEDSKGTTGTEAKGEGT